jgi:tyrosine-specific transport protein
MSEFFRNSIFYGCLGGQYSKKSIASKVIALVKCSSQSVVVIEIGDLIQELSTIAKWPFVQLLVWWISLLAIVTSILGVGIGLCDAFKGILSNIIRNSIACRLMAVILTVLPAYLVAVLIPNAFIVVLGFAGMILAIIAILLPAYLLRQARVQKFHYAELERKWLTRSSTVAAIIIIGCEIFNMLSK